MVQNSDLWKRKYATDMSNFLASNGTNYKKQQVHKCIVEHLIGQDKLGNSDNV